MPSPQGYPQQPPFSPPAGSQTNGIAIASLVCGVLGCVPVVTSLAAIILGVVGIKKAKPPVGGKGFAIGGIVLGLIGLIVWGGIGGVSYWGYGYAKKMIASTELVSTGFFANLAKGDLAAASQAATSNMSQSDLQNLSEQIKELGAFKSFSISSFNADSSTGTQLRFDVGGTANFEKGTKAFSGRFVGTTEGGFKVDDMSLE